MDNKPDTDDLERLFVPLRLQQLEENPVMGNFDRPHLQEIHKRIFQDLPEFAPGEFRTQDMMKARVLESMLKRYVVPYAPSADIGASLDKTLSERGGMNGLHGMGRNQFIGLMAKLYGDLDYIHPFKEGNSRTLRAFTEQLASAVGFDLAWKDLGKDEPAKARDRLYIARDTEVINRMYPGLDMNRAAITQDRREYLSFTQIVSPFKDADPLEKIIKDIARRHQDLAVAEAAKTLAQQWNAVPGIIQCTGRIVALSEAEIIQDAGRGRHVVWDRRKIQDINLDLGNSVTIHGSGNVVHSQLRSGLGR